MINASVIIPTYNSEVSIGPTLESLEPILNDPTIEIIFVDDFSSDSTVEVLGRFSGQYTNVKMHVLKENSGGAATPRNLGLQVAMGEYVFFLDSDDPLSSVGFRAALDIGLVQGSDIVRTPIEVRRPGRANEVVDKIEGWHDLPSLQSQISGIVKFQSLTVSCLFRRKALLDNQILFETSRRIGEDIVFTASVLAIATRIDYSSIPARAYIRRNDGNTSVTQSLSSIDFLDFFRSWNDVESRLQAMGISFFHLHGLAAINYCLRQYLWFGKEPLSEGTFEKVSQIVGLHWKSIEPLPLSNRFKQVLNILRQGTLDEINQELRIRLLVAGHDLKFTNSILSHLPKRFCVKRDQWDGHSKHNQLESEHLVAWADVIWCEWLLGAAVWYSVRKRVDQELIVRCHRSEVMATYGQKIKLSSVSKFVAISPHGLDDFSDRFAISRRKFELIPNAVDVRSFLGRPKERSSCSRLLMVGNVPKLKGYHRAIELLAKLRQYDSSFSLTVIGKSPEDLDWLWMQEEERRYFELCESRIDILGLRSSVNTLGWRDLQNEYSKFDVLLSLSDFEGCQVAPLEAMAAGLVPVVRPWRGARECYPSDFVVPDDELVERILDLQNEAIYRRDAAVGLSYVESNFSVECVAHSYENLFASFRA